MEYLYQHWTACPDCDIRATLLYEGISNRPDLRTGQHQEDKPYWALVDTIKVEPMWGMTREEAEQEETNRIRLHRPPFNRRDNDYWHLQELQRSRLLGSVSPRDVMVSARAWVWVRFVPALQVGMVGAIVGFLAGALAFR